MSSSECLIDECVALSFKRSLCKIHYGELLRRGQVGDIRIDRAPCSVDGCDRVVRSSGSPYCVKHYSRVRRHGHAEETRPWSPTTGQCPVEGCDRDQQYNGMCGTHAQRVSRHGDPNAFTHQRDRNLPRGAANRNWTGSQVTYNGAHQRVQYQRGKASAHQCVDCHGTAAHWSYDHHDPAELSSEYGPYSADPQHYVPRCVPCHKRHDLALLPRDHPGRAFLDAVQRLHGEGVRVVPMARQLGVSKGRINAAFDILGLPRFRPGSPGGRQAKSQAGAA